MIMMKNRGKNDIENDRVVILWVCLKLCVVVLLYCCVFVVTPR